MLQERGPNPIIVHTPESPMLPFRQAAVPYYPEASKNLAGQTIERSIPPLEASPTICVVTKPPESAFVLSKR